MHLKQRGTYAPRRIVRPADRPIIEAMEPRRLLSTAPAPFVPPTEYAPGTIEAEDFNSGGEGVGFHNPIAGNGGKIYRPDNVAIAASTDAGGGFFVGSTQSGEWLNYTVNVSNTTPYTFDLRVRALAGGGVFHLSVDGVKKATFHVPAAGWQNWTTISSAAISLTAGKHVVRIFVDSAPAGAASAVDINWMRMRDNPLTSPRTKWWRDAKYGMLVHLGIYSMLGGYYVGKPTPWYGELIMSGLNIPAADYDKLAAQFNPSNFNANDYVALAKAAGMKYIVFTAKHHDGFSMYNSSVSDFNIVKATPFGRDPLRELDDACHAAGLGFGIDYSILDWQYPEQTPNVPGPKDPNNPGIQAYINGKLKPQLRELITNYNPDILWFDGEWKPWWTEESGRELEQFCRSLKPTLIFNNRVGKRTSADGDFDTPEQTAFTSGDPGRLWETDMSLNNTFGYRSDDNNWKSPATVIQTLMNVVSFGGNFLLNVGPDGTGTIPPASVSVLQQAGQWVNANADAIYGTTMAPVSSASWGDITRKGNTLYAVVLNWPTTGTLHLNVAGTVAGAKFLVGGQAVPFTSGPSGIDLTIPTVMPQQPATVIQIDFSGNMTKVK